MAASKIDRPMQTARNGGFTLLEVFLAIALTSVVLFLLTTAIELYMFRVDASRTRVESAQAARVILDQIASDLRATRFVQSSTGGNETGQNAAGQNATEQGGSELGANNSPTTTAGVTTDLLRAAAPGINGQQSELRIDRTPVSYWDRLLRAEDALLESDSNTAPQTIRYYLEDGSRRSSQRAAQLGVETAPTAKVAGLYRQVIPTAALQDPNASVASASTSVELGEVQLMAPEVVEILFAYFDGVQYWDYWYMSDNQALPLGVEIRLKVLNLSYEAALEMDSRARSTGTSVSDREVVEFRRFVSLPPLRRIQPEAQHLLMRGSQSQGGGGSGAAGAGGDADDEQGGADAP